MNKLDVELVDIHFSGGVILADLDAGNTLMSALLIDAIEKPEWLRKGNQLFALFKETEVTIAKNFTGTISTRNILPCQVLHIDRGELLSVIKMKFNETTIGSAITTRASDHLELKLGDHVFALIKSNEITLMEK